MTIAWPPTLIDTIARRRAVILIGSGVSANAHNDNGQHPPTWGEFLSNAYKNLGKRIPHIKSALSRYDYLTACDFLKSEYNEQWHALLQSHFSQPNYKPAEIHQAIFDLDSRIIASLNFDKIYDTYALTASENTVIIKNYYDDDIRQVVAGPGRYIVKPHGTIDSASRMIFTLDDYGAARVKHAPFYEIMTALLHTHVFLCVGVGLSDPDIKLIFEDYKYKHSESPHYITLPAPMSAAECGLIQKTRGLNVLKYSAKDSHRELTDSLKSLGVAVSERRDQMAKEQDW